MNRNINPTDRANKLARALQVRADVESFTARWPAFQVDDAAPAFSWQSLERQLVDLAPSDLQAEIVRGLLTRVRETAAMKPAEMVLREILKIAVLVLEDDDTQSI
jgi:hypothetical protein